jgi:hypothetical protein
MHVHGGFGRHGEAKLTRDGEEVVERRLMTR